VSNGSGESILQPGLLTTGQISLGAGGLTINPVDSTVSRVLANNTTVSVGNSTINTHYSNATLLISNSTSTTILNLTNLRIGNTTTNVVIANTTSMFGGNVAISGTLSGNVDISGSYRSNIVAVPALDINCSTGNYFTKTINATSTFTFSNVPSSRAYSFTLELTHTSGSITWPTAVRWPSNTAPTLTTGRTHLFMFVTDDGGTRWRGSALANYDN
jgi:hypothetical protein